MGNLFPLFVLARCPRCIIHAYLHWQQASNKNAWNSRCKALTMVRRMCITSEQKSTNSGIRDGITQWTEATCNKRLHSTNQNQLIIISTTVHNNVIQSVCMKPLNGLFASARWRHDLWFSFSLLAVSIHEESGAAFSTPSISSFAHPICFLFFSSPEALNGHSTTSYALCTFQIRHSLFHFRATNLWAFISPWFYQIHTATFATNRNKQRSMTTRRRW